MNSSSNRQWPFAISTRSKFTTGIVMAIAIIAGLTLWGIQGGSATSSGLSGLKGSAANSQQPASVSPAQLPESEGFVPTPSNSSSWSEVATSSAPLWSGVVSDNNPAPFSASQLGLTGGLSQVWVSSSAVTKYGDLGDGLQLPVPLSFAQANPGPVEIDVQEFSFSNSQSPETIYNSPAYSHADWSGFSASQATPVSGGRVSIVDSGANDGLSEFQFQWVDNDNWVMVSVLGASMTEAQAAGVATQVAG